MQPTHPHFMKNRFYFQTARHSMPLALLLMATAARAQVVQIIPVQPAAAVEAPGEARPAVNPPPAAEAPKPDADAETDEAKLVKKLREMKFDRSPEAVLAATKTQRKSEDLAPEDEFNMSVMFGDWAAVGKVAKRLAEDDGYLIGTSGTVTCLAGVHLKLDRYRRDKVDGSWLSRAEGQATMDQLRELGVTGRAKLPTIGEERAPLMLAGCAIMEAVWEVFDGHKLRVADRGLREGVLLSMMHGQKPQRRRRPKRPGRRPAPDGGGNVG